MNNIDKKWYQRSVWIIIFLIFFFPVGLFLMWKYSNWNKIVKGTISGFLALVTVIALFSPKVQPEKIEISIANYQDEYDVNTNIALTATFYPENSTTTVTYHSTGKNITFSGSRLNTGTVEGIYEVYAIAGGKKSNTLSITVVDMAAKKAEEQRLAEEKAAKKAEEQRLAEEKAAKEAEEQRLAEEKAAKEGSTAQNKDNDSENGDNFNTYDNKEQQNTSFSYVLNTNTRRFHYSSCGNVKKIAQKNYATSNDSRSDLIAQGYKPCGVCKP